MATKRRMAGDRRISARECTYEDRTPCEVKVAVGIASDDGRRTVAPNMAALDRLRSRLDRGGSVSEAEARRELTAWARSTLTNPATPERYRNRARVVADALHLRAD
jgi:hypothetical protein